MLNSLSGKTQETKLTYSISGKINGTRSEQFLYIIGPITAGKQKIDSVKLKSGEFKISGNSEEPALANVFLKDLSGKKTASASFYLDGSPVTFTAGLETTAQTFVRKSVTGSKLQDEISLIHSNADQFSQLPQLRDAYKKALSDKDSLEMKVLDKKIQNAASLRRGNLEKFAKDNPEKWASLFILMYDLPLRNLEALNQVKSLLNNLNPAIRSGYNAKTLFSKIEFSERKYLMGKVPEDFAQKSHLGKLIKLSDYRGKYVLIDFWASWCHPCREENPNLLRAFNLYNGNGFEILAVSLDTKKDAWIKAIQEDKLPWTQVSDLKYPNDVANQFGVNTIPDNFLLDPQGKVIGQNLRGKALDVKLAELFGEKK